VRALFWHGNDQACGSSRQGFDDVVTLVDAEILAGPEVPEVRALFELEGVVGGIPPQLKA
jgi:hypothetical protein